MEGCRHCCLDLDLALLRPSASYCIYCDAFPRYDGCHSGRFHQMGVSGYISGKSSVSQLHVC